MTLGKILLGQSFFYFTSIVIPLFTVVLVSVFLRGHVYEFLEGGDEMRMGTEIQRDADVDIGLVRKAQKTLGLLDLFTKNIVLYGLTCFLLEQCRKI